MKSEFSSSANIVARIFQKLAEAVHDVGGSDADLRQLETDRGLAHKVAEVIVGWLNFTEFFQTREGLWVSDEFRERILAPALAEARAAPATVGKYFDLPKSLADAEIRDKLRDRHLFESPRAFCFYLADALTHQWGGTAGNLLTNGHANLWYVLGRNEEGKLEVFTVRAYWFSGDRRWNVSPCQLGAYDWPAGYRAFPRNC